MRGWVYRVSGEDSTHCLIPGHRPPDTRGTSDGRGLRGERIATPGNRVPGSVLVGCYDDSERSGVSRAEE